jgi:two-component sensor histidine kinase
MVRAAIGCRDPGPRPAATTGDERIEGQPSVFQGRAGGRMIFGELSMGGLLYGMEDSLQIIVSVLRMQMQGRNAEVQAALSAAIRRIHTVGRAHEIVDCDLPGGTVDLGAAIAAFLPNFDVAMKPGVEIAFEAEIATLALSPAEARNVLVVIDELVTNALMHGYPGERTGRVTVSIAVCEHPGARARVAVSDDGIGLAYDPTDDDGSGLAICRALLRGGGSELSLVSGPGLTMFEFLVPDMAEPPAANPVAEPIGPADVQTS